MTTKFVSPQRLKLFKNKLETDSVLAKRMHNVEQSVQGKLQETQTDSTSAYTKTVVAGALDYARLTQWGGKSFVWNQLLNHGDFSGVTTSDVAVANGTSSISDGVLTVTSNYESSGRNFYFSLFSTNALYFNVISGHKYLISLSLKMSVATQKQVLLSLWSASPNTKAVQCRIQAPESNTWTNINAIGTATASISNGRVLVWADNYDFVSGDSYQAKNVIVFDLTQMFGAGNEPATAEAFRAMFPASYYAYTSSAEVMSACMTGIHSDGKNLLNIPNDTKTNGVAQISSNDGVILYTSTASEYDFPFYVTSSGFVAGTEHYREYEKVRLAYAYQVPVGQVTVSVSYSGRAGFWVSLVSEDEEGNNVSTLSSENKWKISPSTAGTSSHTFTTTSERRNIMVLVGNSNCPLVEIKIQIESGSTATSWRPYLSETWSVPSAIQAMDGYGWETPSHNNRTLIDNGTATYIQTVTRYTFTGNETWVNVSGDTYKFAGLPNVLGSVGLQIRVSGGLNARVSGSASAYSEVGDIWLGSWAAIAGVYVVVPSGTTPASYMQGKTIYYPMATPVITDVTQYLSSNVLHVNEYGKLTFLNSLTNMNIPLPSTEKFEVSINDAIFAGS